MGTEKPCAVRSTDRGSVGVSCHEGASPRCAQTRRGQNKSWTSQRLRSAALAEVAFPKNSGRRAGARRSELVRWHPALATRVLSGSVRAKSPTSSEAGSWYETYLPRPQARVHAEALGHRDVVEWGSRAEDEVHSRATMDASRALRASGAGDSRALARGRPRALPYARAGLKVELCNNVQDRDASAS